MLFCFRHVCGVLIRKAKLRAGTRARGLWCPVICVISNLRSGVAVRNDRQGIVISRTPKGQQMPTFDLHFHANIHRMPGWDKILRMQKLQWHFRRAGVDYVASTEHSYKKPLEAYLRLADAVQELPTHIIPGVESVSAEGIDIIYLYRNEENLRRALAQFQTFRWTIRDVAAICRDTEAISIVPHPFHIGKSSAGNILCRRAYRQLLRMSDYVEVHNGSALAIEKRLSSKRVSRLFKRTRHKLDKTLNLPMEDRGEGLGWAVSSDSHYPGEQFIVGYTDLLLEPGEDVFDFLGKRIRFDMHYLGILPENNRENNARLLRSLQGVIKEGLVKECTRAIGRTRKISAFGHTITLY